MSRPSSATVADYVIVAISPLLIMMLVGSLMFFMTNLFYDGQFPGRLRFAIAMFVLAAVLIARLSIEEGREYASLFAAPLALVTLWSLMRYTDASFLLALPLVAFVWWWADRLTWDCTVIEQGRDASGQGLLQTMGFAGPAGESADAAGPETTDPESDLSATTARAANRKALGAVWRQWWARRRRFHTPGVWVVYFSLASLPLFAIGQWMLPDAAEVRSSSFRWLMVFVASALALLLTTSLLQLRRYLRQRRLEMPVEMAGIWLGTGAALIAGLMLACLILPRPRTEVSLLDTLDRIGSRPNLQASRRSAGSEGVENPQSATPATVSGEQANRAADAPGNKEGSGNKKSSGNKEGSGNKDRAGSKDRAGDGGKDNRPNGSGSTNGGQDRSGRGTEAGRERVGGHREMPPAPDAAKSDSPPSGRPAPPRAGNDRSSGASSPAGRFRNPWEAVNLNLGAAFKWGYWLLLGVVLLYLVIRYGGEIAKALAQFWQDLMNLFRRQASRSDSPDATSTESLVSPPALLPFSAYKNPFIGNRAKRLTTEQLVRHTFEAMQAWGYERGVAKLPDQTAWEFAVCVANHEPAMDGWAKDLATVYAQTAYAKDLSLPTNTAELLRRVWTVMTSS